MTSRAGFTIVEALITVLVFSLFMGAVFIIFDIGLTGFETSVARQGVQNDARRLGLYVDKELRSSNLVSFFVEDGVTRELNLEGRDVHRDALCFVSVKNWRNEAFDPLAVEPRWDSYVCYYATRGYPVGRLIRSVIEPPPEEIGPWPWEGLTGTFDTYFNDDPTLNGPAQTSFRVIANNVQEFRVVASTGGGKVHMRLRLREQTARFRSSGDRIGSTFELNYSVTPYNTK